MNGLSECFAAALTAPADGRSAVARADDGSASPSWTSPERDRVRSAGRPTAGLLATRGEPEASCQRWCCRLRRVTTPASSTTPPSRARSATIIAAGLERALSLDWKAATPKRPHATVDDYLEVIDRAVEHCGGKRQLDRRLPGRLARDGLHRTVARAREHADAGRSADRLPRRRAGHPRGRRTACAGRRPSLLRGIGRRRRRRAEGRAHARRLHPDPAAR